MLSTQGCIFAVIALEYVLKICFNAASSNMNVQCTVQCTSGKAMCVQLLFYIKTKNREFKFQQRIVQLELKLNTRKGLNTAPTILQLFDQIQA